MKNSDLKIKFLLLTALLAAGSRLPAQSWELAKEKDGIKIYTRNEPGSSLKSFRGETIIHAPMEKVSPLLANPKRTDWWAKEISSVKILGYEENRYFRYYLIYDLPWPLTDRDLAVDARITTDPVSGEKKVLARPMNSGVPENPDLVRIRKYWQQWTVQPLDKGNLRIVLEGFADPAGYVPAWLYNMVITDTPLRAIQSLRHEVLGH